MEIAERVSHTTLVAAAESASQERITERASSTALDATAESASPVRKDLLPGNHSWTQLSRPRSFFGLLHEGLLVGHKGNLRQSTSDLLVGVDGEAPRVFSKRPDTRNNTHYSELRYTRPGAERLLLPSRSAEWTSLF